MAEFDPKPGLVVDDEAPNAAAVVFLPPNDGFGFVGAAVLEFPKAGLEVLPKDGFVFPANDVAAAGALFCCPNANPVLESVVVFEAPPNTNGLDDVVDGAGLGFEANEKDVEALVVLGVLKANEDVVVADVPPNANGAAAVDGAVVVAGAAEVPNPNGVAVEDDPDEDPN